MAATMLVVLPERRGAESCLVAVKGAADVLGAASATVLHVRVDPMTTIMPTEEVMTAAHRRALEEQSRREGQELRALFENWRTTAGVAADWVDVTGTEKGEIDRLGKDAALIIMATPPTETGGHAREALHAALFDTGRPVLLIPSGWSGAFGRHVVIGWKDSEVTRRTIFAARPWLTRAEQVSVIAVGEGEATAAKPLLDEMNVGARFETVADDGRSAGIGLLAEAARLGGDCLFMGAYRRNRLVEWVLGGTTKDVLEQARLPVLMLH